MMHVEGYHEYIGRCLVHRGYHEYIGGYHEYIGGCSVHLEDIMMHACGEQVDKSLSISIQNRCTHDIP